MGEVLSWGRGVGNKGIENYGVENSEVENSEVENRNPENEKARTFLCGPRFDLRELRALIADPRGAGVIEIINGAQEAHGADYAWPLACAQAGI